MREVAMPVLKLSDPTLSLMTPSHLTPNQLSDVLQLRAEFSGPDFAFVPGVGATGGSLINPAGDVDTWGFEMSQGMATRVTVYGEGGLDPTLTVYDPSDHQIAFSDDRFGLNPSVDFQAATSGYYILAVGGYGGTTGSYHIRATDGIPFGNDVGLHPLPER